MTLEQLKEKFIHDQATAEDIDRVFNVITAAKVFIEFDADSDDHDRLEYAIKALEAE